MATNNAVNVPLSGNTGTGNFVGANTPALITPNIGIATATSLVFNPTTNGIIGTTAGDNAGSGYVGQFITSNIPAASATSLTTAQPKNITTISLTAGDWDVFGNVVFFMGSTTVIQDIDAWTSITSVTIPDFSLISAVAYNSAGTYTSGAATGIQCPYLRVNVTGNQIVYLSANATFGVSTITACGSIFARRVR